MAAATGIVTIVAGNVSLYTSSCFSGHGGLATNAGLCDVSGIAVDAAGNLFIADNRHYVVYKVRTICEIV